MIGWFVVRQAVKGWIDGKKPGFTGKWTQLSIKSSGCPLWDLMGHKGWAIIVIAKN